MPCRATQAGQATVASSDKMWSTGEGNGKPLQYCLENPMDSMKRQKDKTLKDEFPRSVGAWYAAGEENGKPLQYCLENPMNSMKRQEDMTMKAELPRSVGAQCATGDQWRNKSRKNEETEPKQKQHPVLDATGDRSKV